jgi:threonine dehydrogenase-like Zn-dependent dehydrogenase
MTATDVLALLPFDTGHVEVVGAGQFADELRALLGDRTHPANPNARPCAIIETSGAPAALESALKRVEDLGTVVLAGPAKPLELDLYADLHVRALTLVGVLS